MKKILLILTVCMIIPAITYPQLINVNPDPNGEPWWAGGFKLPDASEMEMIKNIPLIILPEKYNSKTLPSAIDNSLNQYFRPVFNQVGGSCAQASGVGYNFTYEMDFRRNVPANTAQNQYPSHYTYNFLNGGSMSNGSNCWDGWNIIKSSGCPNVADYGGMSPPNNINWMNGYTKYYNGMHNKTIEFFKIYAGYPEGLQTLKHYFNDHGEEAAVGGLVNFYAGATGYTMVNLPAGTPNAGMKVITRWGTSVNHAMTFAGYDDSIRYDFNNDGKYTNHLDINGDLVVDMRDWEIGGLIVVNSWGTSWGNGGKSYMMYKLLAEPTNNGGVFGGEVYTIKVRPVYEPILTFKITIKHNSRNKIKITAGSSPNINDTVPSFVLNFPMFNCQGGNFYMQGGSTPADQTIEIGLDVTPLLSYIQSNQSSKFFLMVDEFDPNGTGQGEIISFSAISYSSGIQETICPQSNVPIINNNRTTLSITKSVVFDPVTITTAELPNGTISIPYSHQLTASGGSEPYTWSVLYDYKEENLQAPYPMINGQKLNPNDLDDGSVKIKLGFPFLFFGKYYDSVHMTTDGSILFNDAFLYIRSDESLISNKAISVFGADLQIYPEQNDGMWFEGNSNYATFRWKISGYAAPDVNVEAAITIYANGEINFFYGNGITPGLTWTGGVSNGDGLNYTIASISNAPIIPDDTKFKFSGRDFPPGMQLDENGLFSGTPTENKTWNINFMITDFNNISNMKIIPFTVSPSGIHEKQNNNLTVDCSPNPFTDQLNFSVNDNSPGSKLMTIEIVDIHGKLIHSICENRQFSNNLNIKWSDHTIKQGVYLVRFRTGNTILYKKIMKM